MKQLTERQLIRPAGHTSYNGCLLSKLWQRCAPASRQPVAHPLPSRSRPQQPQHLAPHNLRRLLPCSASCDMQDPVTLLHVLLKMPGISCCAARQYAQAHQPAHKQSAHWLALCPARRHVQHWRPLAAACRRGRHGRHNCTSALATTCLWLQAAACRQTVKDKHCHGKHKKQATHHHSIKQQPPTAPYCQPPAHSPFASICC
jgi:hypothetical protein